MLYIYLYGVLYWGIAEAFSCLVVGSWAVFIQVLQCMCSLKLKVLVWLGGSTKSIVHWKRYLVPDSGRCARSSTNRARAGRRRASPVDNMTCRYRVVRALNARIIIVPFRFFRCVVLHVALHLLIWTLMHVYIHI